MTIPNCVTRWRRIYHEQGDAPFASETAGECLKWLASVSLAELTWKGRAFKLIRRLKRQRDEARAERDHHRETLRRIVTWTKRNADLRALMREREPWLFEEEKSDD